MENYHSFCRSIHWQSLLDHLRHLFGSHLTFSPDPEHPATSPIRDGLLGVNNCPKPADNM
jgi:hypothetical protein